MPGEERRRAAGGWPPAESVVRPAQTLEQRWRLQDSDGPPQPAHDSSTDRPRAAERSVNTPPGSLPSLRCTRRPGPAPGANPPAIARSPEPAGIEASCSRRRIYLAGRAGHGAKVNARPLELPGVAPAGMERPPRWPGYAL